jgi:hypothetical protein
MRKSRLVKDTTREEREAIVAQALAYSDDCDGLSGLSSSVAKMYEPYIEGVMELSECNRAAATGKYVQSDHGRISTGASCIMGN